MAIATQEKTKLEWLEVKGQAYHDLNARLKTRIIEWCQANGHGDKKTVATVLKAVSDSALSEETLAESEARFSDIQKRLRFRHFVRDKQIIIQVRDEIEALVDESIEGLQSGMDDDDLLAAGGDRWIAKKRQELWKRAGF